jgi:hypothetical protein
MLATRIDPSKVRDISPLLLDSAGRLKVVPAAVLAGTTRDERTLFGVRHAFYGFLTQELVDFLSQTIAGRSAIEIGAGHGGLAAALGIPATDNHQQDTPEISAYYRALKQPTVRYGGNVEKLDAAKAVAKYKPAVVVASWVTHRYDPSRQEAGGNQDGVTEEAIIDACDTYVLIGNERVHATKSTWTRPHEILRPSWLYSRAGNGSPDFIAIWKRPL